ncbi:MAG: GNAT family N-acetyltransferase [Anaerolineae bacterium]|nr:GNAT family N-acetyltransferase [Anaerolineae bacterium]NUQ04442.1 GNAT family N-acetyltransferase [Anaerolineae bacterium]
MFVPGAPYSKPLGSGFTLKSVDTLEDAERVAAFNAVVFGSQEEALSRVLLMNHPHTRPEHWLYAEEDSSGRVAASLCLIPWRWNYAGVELRSGELGICATLEPFRNQGLIRALTVRHKELLREGGFHLSHIQGIPYFYRQFGYEYVLPLEGGWEIELRQIASDLPENYMFRPGGIADIPTLAKFYDDASRDYDISARRDAGVWRFILEPAPGMGTNVDVFLLLNSAGYPVGYWCIQHYGFGEGLNVGEASRLDHASASALLPILRRQALERDKPYIRLITPDDGALVRTAAGRGAHDTGRYQWQIHIPDASHFLRAIAPALERRLAGSMFAGLTQTVIFNLYREAFALRFESGRLAAVEPRGSTEGSEIRIPPLLFPVLALGWKTRQELAERYPDFIIRGHHHALLDTLFPRMNACLYPNY